MFCKNCGNNLVDGSRFCGGCGKKTAEDGSVIEEARHHEFNNSRESGREEIIKCGNCQYIGKGQKARSTWAIILAWLCVFLLAPMITIIYYLATSKYKCPKCKSTFLGVKNEYGVFVGQKGSSGGRIALILLCILIEFAFIGILSSIVLASLQSARAKGQDASIKYNLSSVVAQAELYSDSQSKNGKDSNYTGLCNDTIVAQMRNSINFIKTEDVVCKDDDKGYAISVPINSGGYWCVDNVGFNGEISSNITSTSCSSLENDMNDSTTDMAVLVGVEMCDKDIPNSTWDGKSKDEKGNYLCDCKSGYSWNADGTACKK